MIPIVSVGMLAIPNWGQYHTFSDLGEGQKSTRTTSAIRIEKVMLQGSATCSTCLIKFPGPSDVLLGLSAGYM